MVASDYPEAGTLIDLAEASKLPAKVVLGSFQDPGTAWPGSPPNLGNMSLPHIFTMTGRYGAQGRSYAFYDEAIRDSRVNAARMRKDASLMECLEHRQRSTALLKWHIEPEDSASQDQKELAEKMTKILERTPDFLEWRKNLLEAIWFGRYGIAHAYHKQYIEGTLRTTVARWEPRHGDKLVFRYEDGTARYKAGQVGIRIGSGYDPDPVSKFNYVYHDHRQVEATQYGLVYWLMDWERRTMAIHKHFIEDAEFEDTLRAGAIHGVGIRDRIYWYWYMMVECLQRAVEYLDRSALGIEIWSFPAHNTEAEAATRKAAQERIAGGRSIVLVPRFSGEDADLYGVQHLEPGIGGVEIIVTVIKEFFGATIKRYILGQTLSSEAAATGLGSGVADAHLATYADIVRYDARKLEETVTCDYLRQMQLCNFPKSADVWLRFICDTDSPNAEQKLAAMNSAYAMGARLKEADVLSTIGASAPDKTDIALQDPAQAQAAIAAQQQEMLADAGMGGPMASGTGGGPFFDRRSPDADEDGVIGEGTAGERPLPLQGPAQYAGDRAERLQRAAADASRPSDAQAEAGNYRKGHVHLHGLNVTIETPQGQRRRPQWPPLAAHYGYIRRTEDRDGDQLDVFLGPEPDSEIVYVIDQETQGGRFDEHKAMLGFTSRKAATDAYRASYTPGWRVGPVTAMTMDRFRDWVATGDLTKRVEPQVSKHSAGNGNGDREDYAARQQRLWREEEHPRDDEGQFAAKGKGKKHSTGDAAQGRSETGRESPAGEGRKDAPQVEPGSKGFEILSIVDTRQWEEGPDDKWRPIAGSGEPNPCQRCGKEHEVHFHVKDKATGKTHCLGSSCAKAYGLGNASQHRSMVTAAKRLKGLQALVETLKQRIERLRAAEAKVAKLDMPTPKSEPWGKDGKSRRWSAGEAFVLDHGGTETITGERLRTLESSWRGRRLKDEGIGYDDRQAPTRLKEAEAEIAKVEARMEKLQGQAESEQEPKKYGAGVYTDSPTIPAATEPRGPLAEDGYPEGTGRPVEKRKHVAHEIAKYDQAEIDPDELARGAQVEMEHTNDPEIAEQIARDHLAEDPAYYRKLAMIERRDHQMAIF